MAVVAHVGRRAGLPPQRGRRPGLRQQRGRRRRGLSVVVTGQPGVPRLHRSRARRDGLRRPTRRPAKFRALDVVVPDLARLATDTIPSAPRPRCLPCSPRKARPRCATRADLLSETCFGLGAGLGVRRGSVCPAGPAVLAGWPSTSWPLGIPSNIVLADVASVPPGLATGRGSRRVPAASQLVNATRMCDAGEASPRIRASAQGRRLRSSSSGARRMYRGSC